MADLRCIHKRGTESHPRFIINADSSFIHCVGLHYSAYPSDEAINSRRYTRSFPTSNWASCCLRVQLFQHQHKQRKVVGIWTFISSVTLCHLHSSRSSK